MDRLELELDGRIAAARRRLSKLQELAAIEAEIDRICAEVLMGSDLKDNIREIVLAVAGRMCVPVALIFSPNRGVESVSRARQIVMFIARSRRLGSHNAIGKVLGGRDHGTVIYGVRAVEDMMQTSPEFRWLVDGLLAEVETKINENSSAIYEGGQNGQGTGRAGSELR